MTRFLLIVAVVSVVAAFGIALLGGEDAADEASPGGTGVAVAQASSATAPQPGEASLSVRAGTRRDVGTFTVARGRTLRLRTLETTDGESCLINVEEPSGIAGSTCHDGGLFAHRDVVFSVNFDGGPGRFSSMYVVGIAAPALGSVSVVRTDGGTVDAALNRDHAFVVESTDAELSQGIFPSAVKAFGRSGRLVETTDIPAPR